MSSYYGGYGAGGSFRRRKPKEDVDPLSSLANIGDIMLVFACGLMVALIMAWNIDLNVTKLDQTTKTEVEEMTTIEDLLSGAGQSYIERGTAYQDPVTGDWYVVEQEEDGK